MFRDAGEKETAENREGAADRQKIKEAQKNIGAELNGEKPEKRTVSGGRQGTGAGIKVKESREEIGAELDGGKPEKKSGLEVKYNKDGEEIKGRPEVRDGKFYLRNENGEILKDARGNNRIDWESYGKYVRDDDQVKKEDGFDRRYEVKEGVLKEGTVVDRYGSERGSFVSPEGASYESRSLPYKEETVEYHKYRVTEDINCREGTAAPNFEQQGGAKQYKLEKTVDYYLNSGALEEVYEDDDK